MTEISFVQIATPCRSGPLVPTITSMTIVAATRHTDKPAASMILFIMVYHYELLDRQSHLASQGFCDITQALCPPTYRNVKAIEKEALLVCIMVMHNGNRNGASTTKAISHLT